MSDFDYHKIGRQNDSSLDPYGIYNTRSAQRLHNMRQQRRAQQIVLALIVAGLFTLGFFAWRIRSVVPIRADKIWELHVSPIAAPSIDTENGTILIPTQDGQIAALYPEDSPLRLNVWLKADFPIYAAPVLGKKYFYVGSEDGVLYAINRKTGKREWQHQGEASITARPCVLGNIVFYGDDAGWLVALRAQDGTVIWRRKLSSQIGDGLGVTTMPSKMVLAPLIGNAAEKGGIWAFDANNGEVKWKYAQDAGTRTSYLPAPVIVSHNQRTRVLGTDDNGTIFNLDASTGTIQENGWAIQLSPEGKDSSQSKSQLLLRQPLLVTEKYVYVTGNDNVIYKVNIGSGTEVWKWQAPHPIQQLLRTAEDNILVICRSKASYLLDSMYGEVKATIKSRKSSPFMFAVLRDQTAWILDKNGTLQRFQLSNLP